MICVAVVLNEELNIMIYSYNILSQSLVRWFIDLIHLKVELAFTATFHTFL